MLAPQPSVQAPAAWWRNVSDALLQLKITRALLRLILGDPEFRWAITAAETGAGLVDADLTFGYVPRDVRRYGAVLDGVEDDTAALQAWASLGGALTYPVPGTALVTDEIDLISDTHIRAVEGATIQQDTANLSVLTAASKENLVVEGMTLHAVGSLDSYYNGNGINFSECERVVVRGCTVRNHRGFGILMDRCIYGEITGNRLLEASVSGAVDHSDVAGDIALLGSNRFRVAHNECLSGNGVGILVQTVQDGDSCRRNVIVGNTIRDCLMYGIALYRGGAGTTHDGTIVIGNSIDNVTGELPEATDGLVYGAGIYAVQASNFVIEGNEISDTHSAGVTVVDNLAPGAIGTTICGAHTIRGNIIRDAGYLGITVRNPGASALGNQPAVVEGNTITGCERHGIEVMDRGNISVRGNKVVTVNVAGNNGITIYSPNDSTQQPGVVVEGNTVRNIARRGIFVTYCVAPVVSGNKAETTGDDGIALQNTVDAVLCGNSVRDAGDGAYGIANYSTALRSVITGNSAQGDGTAGAMDYGFNFSAWWKTNRTNYSSGHAVAAAFGDYIPEVGATPAAGTWLTGDHVWYTNPAAAGFEGLVCSAGGTPGTWKTFGAVTP